MQLRGKLDQDWSERSNLAFAHTVPSHRRSFPHILQVHERPQSFLPANRSDDAHDEDGDNAGEGKNDGSDGYVTNFETKLSVGDVTCGV